MAHFTQIHRPETTTRPAGRRRLKHLLLAFGCATLGASGTHAQAVTGGTFLGGTVSAPHYGAQGVLPGSGCNGFDDWLNFDLSGDIGSSANWYASSTTHFTPGPTTDVFISGASSQNSPIINGPPTTCNNLLPVYGQYYPAYIGPPAGPNLSGGGTFNSLYIQGPATYNAGAVTVAASITLEASGGTPIETAASFATTGFVQGQLASGDLAVTGGILKGTTAILMAHTTPTNSFAQVGQPQPLAPIPGVTGNLSLSGTEIDAVNVQVVPFARGQSFGAGAQAQTVALSGGAMINATGEFDAVGPSETLSPGLGGTTTLTLDHSTVHAGVVALAAGIDGLNSASRGDPVSVTLSNQASLVADTTLYVGQSGSANLKLSGGSQLTDREGVIGDAASGFGAVTLDGGSWTNTGYLAVGNNGVGQLTLQNGATVTNTGPNGNAFIAGLVGSSGSKADVTGKGASWTTSGVFQVGVSDNGVLIVEAGAKVSAGNTLTAGLLPGSDGTVSVLTGGSLTADSQAGAGTAAIVLGNTFASSGTLSIDGAGSVAESKQSVVVGLNGTGEIDVTNGGALVVDGLQLRLSRATGTGTVNISGSGSKVTVANGVTYVGYVAEGRLAVSGGGALSTSGLNIGGQFGSEGAATITDAGSTLSVTGTQPVIIGDSGSGRLLVGAGATADFSQQPVTLGNAAGADGTLTIQGGSVSASTLIVGEAGQGTLVIDGPAGALHLGQTGKIVLGDGASGVGRLQLKTVTFDLADAQANGGVVIGNHGKGVIDVQDGATLKANNLNLGLKSLGGELDLSGAGAAAVLSGDVGVGAAADGVGTVDIQGAGASLKADSLTIAKFTSAIGAVGVSGAGDKLTIAGALTLGNPLVTGEHALFQVTGGSAAISADATYVYANDGSSSGQIMVSGAGATFKTNQLYISGQGASATFRGGAFLSELDAGGGASALRVTLADSGRLVLDGAGATTALGPVMLASGTLAVTNGADVTASTVTTTSGDKASAITLNAAKITVSDAAAFASTDLTLEGGATLSAGQFTVSNAHAGAGLRAISLSAGSTIETTDGGQASAIDLSGASVTLTDSTMTFAGGLVVNGGGNAAAAGLFQLNGTSELDALSAGLAIMGEGEMTVASGSHIFLQTLSVGDTSSQGFLTLEDGARLAAANGGAFIAVLNRGLILLQGDAKMTGLDQMTVNSGLLKVEDNAHLSIASLLSTYAGGTVDTTGGVVAVGSLFGIVNNPFFYAVTPTGPFRTSNYLIVGSGGTLNGTGTIIGDVFNVGGTVHAGHSPGTLTITGGYSQTADGTLLLSIGPNSYSRLVVSGPVSLSGTVELQGYQGGQLRVGQTYSFITAAGGVTGSFSRVVSDNGFTTAVPSLVGGSLMFTAVHTPGSFAAASVTPNQIAMARVLDAEAVNPTGPLSALTNALADLPAADAPAVLDRVSPEGLVASQTPRFSTARQFSSLLRTVSPANRAGEAWASAFDDQRQAPGDSAQGLAPVTSLASGMALGMDRDFGDGWRIGVAAGSSRTHYSVNSLLTSGKVTGGHLALSATRTFGDAYVSGLLNVAAYRDSGRRATVLSGVTTLSSRAHSVLLDSRWEAGWRWRPVGAAVVTPYVALDAATLQQRAFQERVASGGALPVAFYVPRQGQASTLATLGARLEWPLQIDRLPVTPAVDLAVDRELEHRRRIDAAFAADPSVRFHVGGATPDATAATIALSLAARIGASGTLYARLESRPISPDAMTSGQIGLRFAW